MPICLKIDARRHERTLTLQIDKSRTAPDAEATLKRIYKLYEPDELSDFLKRWVAVMRRGWELLWSEFWERQRKTQNSS